MTTAAISNASPRLDAGYFANLGRAALSFFSALVAVPVPALNDISVDADAPAIGARARRYEDEMSLYRLYRLSSPYDSVSPAVLTELRYLAARS